MHLYVQLLGYNFFRVNFALLKVRYLFSLRNIEDLLAIILVGEFMFDRNRFMVTK